jgi:signal transduction histidine kinase
MQTDRGRFPAAGTRFVKRVADRVARAARAAREPLSLRATLLLMTLAAGVYAGVLPLYLYVRARAAALALGKGTAAMVALQDDLARRNSGLHHAASVVRQLVESPTRPAPGALDTIRLFIAAASAPAAGPSYATVPAALRAPLGRSEAAVSRVASALAEDVALLERGGVQTGSARRIRTLDSLTQIADQQMLAAGQQARRDLLDRQQALQLAAGEVLRDAILWLALGALGVAPAVYLVRRRVWRPLAELEAGLARVADGDLTEGVPVRGSDEMGRLAQHFNEMTRVLRDRAEEQGRFAAAGELLAGVAHEVNNPLMAIAAHAENSIADPALPEPQRAEMLQILRQARRAAKLLRGLLRFVRVTDREVTRVNLNDVVRGAMDLVSYRFALDEIAVGGRLDPGLVAVEGDAIKLEQVIVNLLSNAIDALRAIKPPRELTVDTWSEGARVSVAVEDNARGVSADMVPRLFRPFATTKARRGTGLGLYISRQIAREAGGDLVLESRPGKGARFVLWLAAAPVEPSVTPSPAPTTPAAASPPSGAARPVASLAGLHVLIVDDEEAVRRPMAKFLIRRGARVVEAQDGAEALERLDGAGGEADVIVADLRMPRMGGVELFATLEDTRPALASRVLFLSGDISQLAEPGNTPVPRERVLVKPVELAELERRILEFIRGRGDEGGGGA